MGRATQGLTRGASPVSGSPCRSPGHLLGCTSVGQSFLSCTLPAAPRRTDTSIPAVSAEPALPPRTTAPHCRCGGDTRCPRGQAPKTSPTRRLPPKSPSTQEAQLRTPAGSSLHVPSARNSAPETEPQTGLGPQRGSRGWGAQPPSPAPGMPQLPRASQHKASLTRLLNWG